VDEDCARPAETKTRTVKITFSICFTVSHSMRQHVLNAHTLADDVVPEHCQNRQYLSTEQALWRIARNPTRAAGTSIGETTSRWRQLLELWEQVTLAIHELMLALEKSE